VRRYETHVPKPRPTEVCVEVRCDLCGETAPNPEQDFDNDFWGAGTYEVEGVTIEHRSGYSAPDAGDVTVTTYDVCPRCFKKTVEAFLQSLGAAPRVSLRTR
jgi:hypothetical protein